MANPITIIRTGSSLAFVFDRVGLSIEGWTCTISVKEFPSDTSAITRVIEPVGFTWPGILTSGETALLLTGTYRLTGLLQDAVTGEQEEIPTRFHISETWAA